MILRSPLPKFYYYHNKRLQVKESQYLIPIYSWTFTQILNWTCSIVTIYHFDARLPNRDYPIVQIPIRDFNHQLEKVVGCKVLQFIPTMKIKKMLGHKTLRCINTATSSQERWTRAKLCLRSQFTWTNFAQHLCNLWTLWQTHKHGLESKHNWKSVFHKPWQIPYLSSCCQATGLNSSLSSING